SRDNCTSNPKIFLSCLVIGRFLARFGFGFARLALAFGFWSFAARFDLSLFASDFAFMGKPETNRPEKHNLSRGLDGNIKTIQLQKSEDQMTSGGNLPRTGVSYVISGDHFMKNSKRIRILCVDDHPVVRDGVAAIIGTQSDMTVVDEAVDGEQAVAKYREH